MPTPDSPTDFNPNSAQLTNEVGDCPHCAALFALPLATEPFDTIACPACEQSISIDEVNLRKVRVAKAIQKPVERPPEKIEQKPADSLPTVADLLATATAPKAMDSEPIEKSVTPDPGHESLDDWLRRTTGVPLTPEKNDSTNEDKSVVSESARIDRASKETIEISTPTPAESIVEEMGVEKKEADEKAAEEKKALSDTLGWTPGSFSLETPAETNSDSSASEPTIASERSQDNLAGNDSSLDFNTKKTVENIDKFVNTLRETSSEQFSESLTDQPVAASAAEPSEDFQFDFKKTLLEADNATKTELSHVDEFGVEEDDYAVPLVDSATNNRVGWGAPLSALAGLLVVGGVSYVVLLNQFFNEEAIDASSNDLAIVEPVEPSVSQPADSFDNRDRGIEVANFESTEPDDTKSDSADVNPAESYTAEPYTGDRYSEQADRYNEPNPFAAADALPVEQSEEPVELEEQVSFDAPLEEEHQPVEPMPTDTNFVQRLIGAPAYGLEELQAAFDYSSPAGKGFARGTLADPQQAQEMGKLYGDLCYLAQVVTLLDTQNMPSGLKTAELLAVDVYKRMLLDDTTSEEVNQVASHWLNWTGRPYGGVFFQGIPDDMTRAGDLYQYRFTLGDSYVYVVTEEPIDINRYIVNDAKQMGVVGIVVEEPSERIAGYEGDAERVVWCRKTIAISDGRWTQ